MFTNKGCDRVFVSRDTIDSHTDSAYYNLEVWDVQHGILLAAIPRPYPSRYWPGEFTPDGDHVRLYRGDSNSIWSLRDGSFTTIRLKTEGYRIAFQTSSHSGDLVLVAPAAGADPEAVGCFSIPQQRWIWWQTDLQKVRSAAFTAGDSEVVVLGENDIYRFTATTGNLRARMNAGLRSYDIGSSHLALSPDGKRFAIWRGRRSDSMIDPLFTLLFVWNPRAYIFDTDRNDFVASCVMPKFGFESGQFETDENFFVAYRGKTIYRLGIAEQSQTRIESDETPDQLKDAYPWELHCFTHDGFAFAKLVQATRPLEGSAKFIQYCSFSGARWTARIPDGGEGVGLSFSIDGRGITLVCKEVVYTIDAVTGDILGRIAAPWILPE